MAGPVIYYSMLLGGEHDALYLRLLRFSLTSLRAVNRELSVCVHVTGPLPPMVGLYLQQHFGVSLVDCGSYAEQLEAAWPGSAAALASYPILHKFFGLAHLPAAEQVLYVDSDTFFFFDPAGLFTSCREADLYAREEPSSPGSPLGYNPGIFDDACFRRVVAAEGARYVRPFNTGAMLLNHKLWARFAVDLPRFVRDCLRFTLAVQPASLPPELAAQLSPLPYPADLLWIRDQVAFWLNLGLLPDFSQAFLSPAQLSLGCVPAPPGEVPDRPIISHYFSKNARMFFSLLQRGQPFQGH